MQDESTLTTMGKLFKYDLSVRLQDTEDMLFRLKQRLLEEGFHIKGVQHKEVKEQVNLELFVASFFHFAKVRVAVCFSFRTSPPGWQIFHDVIFPNSAPVHYLACRL